jgi:GntR family transcriptional regulator, rspAB operon transcriptional repressor
MTSEADKPQPHAPQLPADRHLIAMRRQTMGVQIRNLLRREIIAGHLLPRAMLSEQELSQRFGVSRTPVREALIKLAEESLVETYPQYGSFVSPIAISEVFDNQFVREAVECSAIERAIERVGEEEVRTLTRIMDRQTMLEAAGDDEAFFAADEQLHEFFLTLAGHPQAWRVVENAKAQLDRVRHLTIRLPRKLSSVLAEHRVIVDRFLARDRAGAVEAMRTHLRGVFRSIEILQRENPDYFASSGGGARSRPAAGKAGKGAAEGGA